MIFLYFCKFFVPRSEGPPLTLYRPGDSQDYQSFDLFLSVIFVIMEKNIELYKLFCLKKRKPYWLSRMGVKTAQFQNGPVLKWPSSKTAPEPKLLMSKTAHFYGAI